jgi:hypothetical protein
MKGLRTGAIAIMIVVVFGLASCGGGTDVRSKHSTYTTTLGQELKDLDESYKNGIITEKQYEDAKKKLIEQRTKEQ